MIGASVAVLADENYMPFTPSETGEQEYGISFAPVSTSNKVNKTTVWSDVHFEGLKTGSTGPYYLAVQPDPICYGSSPYLHTFVVSTIDVGTGNPSSFDANVSVDTIKLYDSDDFTDEHQVKFDNQQVISGAGGKTTYYHPSTYPSSKVFRSSFVLSIYTRALTYDQDYYLVLDKGIPDKDGKTLADKVAIKFTIGHNHVDEKCSVCGAEKPKPEPSNTWITFPEGVNFVDADENDDIYQTDAPFRFNCDGSVSFSYSVDGAQKYGHVHIQNPDGSISNGATVDEPDGTSRTATISGLVPDKEYRLFWDMNDVSNKLTKNVVLYFRTTEEAPPPHTEEVVPPKTATCTEPGLTDGKKCSVCGEWIVKQEEIPAKGHTEEVVKGKAATCTEKGLTDGKKCSVCDAVLEEQEEIPALGHDFKDGKCTRCDAADPDYKPTPVEPVSKFTGLANEADKDGNWWYYTDGKIDKTHTGVDQNKYGWWRVENGKVNFKAQGIYQNKYGWWKTTDGEVTFKENSIYQNQFGWWKCKDSKVDFSAQSIYQNQYGWWKTTDGKVTFKENGLFKNQYGTWKVENSKVNFNYNGTYQGKTIKNGKVQ